MPGPRTAGRREDDGGVHLSQDAVRAKQIMEDNVFRVRIQPTKNIIQYNEILLGVDGPGQRLGHDVSQQASAAERSNTGCGSSKRGKGREKTGKAKAKTEEAKKNGSRTIR
jgi:hypothetical protein